MIRIETEFAKEYLLKLAPKIMRDFKNIMHQKNRKLAFRTFDSVKSFAMKSLSRLSEVTSYPLSDTPITNGWFINFDGISNFVCDIPLFGISLSLFINGELIASLVSLPCRNELFVIERSQGVLVFSFDEGGLQKCSNTSELKHSCVTTNMLKLYEYDISYISNMSCNLIAYLYTAIGRFDGCVLELDQNELKIAKHILAEGNCKISMHSSNLLIGSNPLIHNSLLTLL